MPSIDIYQFEDPVEIFIHVFNLKTKRNSLFSIRAWSRQMGFRNPSHVADILNRRRNLTVEFALRVSGFLDLTRDERTYFESLVFLKNAKNPSEKEYFANIVSKIKPGDQKKAILPDKYVLIKEWYYGVLDEMTCLFDFKFDPQYLSKRLGSEVTPQAISTALTDLIKLGSIGKTQKGKLFRPQKAYFKTAEKPDQPEDPNLRSYRRKFIEKTLRALDEQTTGESFFRMTNIPIKISKFKEFKERIEEFAQEISKLEATKDADEVYQLNIQFCRVTSKIP